jgi:hypothetical protein
MNLYRRRTLEANFALVLILACSIGLAAAAQRRKPHKLRSTALVELTTSASGTTTARVVPITILDDGSFHDAGIYKNTPQPMALDGGVVYEAQKTGQILGYVTVGNATKDKNGNWVALGRWQAANPKPKPKADFSASELSGPRDNSVSDDGGRPVLHRTPGSSTGSQDGGSAPSSSPSGDNRPVLRRPSGDTSTQSTPSPTPSSTPAPSDDRPVLRRPSGDSSAQSTPSPAPSASPSATPEAPEASDDPDRPTLRHRAPPSAQQPEVVDESKPAPKTARPAATPSGTPKPSTPASTSSTSAAPATQTLVAVSDAQAIEPRSYEFAWKGGEQEAIETKMRRLAVAQVPGSNAGSLANVVIRTFDLDLSNEPVVVLTAEVPPGAAAAVKPANRAPGAAKSPRNPPEAGNAPAPTSQATRYITVIARVDFEGNPQKLAASVTDSTRLDVAPRLELIDAVDVDGDGLAELLFRQYSFDDKSVVIYQIGRSTVTKLFEGASLPLK